MNSNLMKRNQILEKVHDNKLSIYEAEKMLKDLITGQLQEAKEDKSFLMYFQQEWVQIDSEPLQSTNNYCYLILDTDRSLYNELEKKCEHTGEKVILAKRGECFQKITDTEYIMNPSSFSDYEELLQQVANEISVPDRIINLWGEKQPENNCYILLYLCQALLKIRDKKIQIINPFKETDTVSDSYNRAVSAIAKTVNIECNKLYIKTLIYENDSSLFNEIWEEIHSQEEICEIKYQNKLRYIRKLKENKRNTENQGKSLLRENGVYIITGGAGKIGTIIAYYLAKKYHASLVLVGRTKNNNFIEKKISRIAELGVSVQYLSADVTNIEDVKRVVLKTKNQFHKINGIIQCAGIIKDSYISNKKIQDFKQVIDVKVKGTLNMDKVTKNENLDFMAYFSSVSAVTGNVGQIDYSYANSFMDNFAEYRNKRVRKKECSGKTISINWPFWKDGGMELSNNLLRDYQIDFGMKAMSNESAITVLEHTLRDKIEENQAIVMYGSEKLRSKLNQMNRSDKKNNNNCTNQSAVTDNNRLIEKTETFFVELFSDLLSISVDELDMDIRFQEYGVDSFIVKEFNEIIEKKLVRLSKTILFEYQTIRELANYVAQEYKEQLCHIFSFEDTAIQAEKVENEPKLFEREKQIISINQDDIAIIGVNIRFPKANNLDELWSLLANEESAITKVPEERWNNEAYYDSDNIKVKQGKYYCPWGGFLKDISDFDPLFFGITPKEAELMDPQERLLLESVWHVMEDSGYTKEVLSHQYTEKSKQNVGVFIGCTSYTYNLIGIDEWNKGNYVTPNSLPWSLANRISFLFNFNGPSVTLDTACSSSLTALHIACQSLKNGDCSTAIVGGVNLYTHPNKYVLFSQLHMLSPTGKCHAFSIDADGFVPGEGVASLLLKPLKEAKKSKDHIYGIVKGSSINHGGQTNGYTVPNPKEQCNLICNALNDANISPEEIGYIETHGTGTILGDPIEVTGITKAYKKYTDKKMFCPIGSVKSNIGHQEGVAGLAGIAKILAQLKYKKLAPSLYTNELNPNIKFEETPLFVQQKLEDWRTIMIEKGNQLIESPRKAAISGFGAGGANAHVIIEEYKEDRKKTKVNNGLKNLFLLSANSEEGVKQIAKELAMYIKFSRYENDSDVDIFLEEIAYVLQCGRNTKDVRVAIYVETLTDLKDTLERICVAENLKEISSDTVITSLETYNMNQKETNLSENTFFDKHQLIYLAKIWVKGQKSNWDKLYHGNYPFKRSIPTYPFEKEHYWVPIVNSIGKVDKLHPMVDNNKSDFNEQYYCKEFSSKDLYIRDHRIDGEMILPGAAYLELVRFCAQDAIKEEDITVLENVYWTKPLQLTDSLVTCKIVLKPTEENIKFEVKTIQDDIDTMHCYGQIIYDPIDKLCAEIFDIELIKSRCTKETDGEKCYEKFQEYGFAYGPYMQSIKTVYSNSNEVLTRIHIPNKYKEDSKFYVLHPSIIDGAFQSVMAVNKSVEIKGNMYLPHKIDKIEIFNRVPERCFEYIMESKEQELQKNQFRFEIYILNDEGRVLVKVSGYTVKKVRSSEIQNHKLSDETVLHIFENIQNGNAKQEEIEYLLNGGNYDYE